MAEKAVKPPASQNCVDTAHHLCDAARGQIGGDNTGTMIVHVLIGEAIVQGLCAIVYAIRESNDG